uniref:Uncharacterized protein n=1 Tax=Clonostachys compactiuscula TaxID=122660 RepID=A0A8F1Y3R7_9HYPO|nr:hypothetical protein [Clonostachys compactiuscula]
MRILVLNYLRRLSNVLVLCIKNWGVLPIGVGFIVTGILVYCIQSENIKFTYYDLEYAGYLYSKYGGIIRQNSIVYLSIIFYLNIYLNFKFSVLSILSCIFSYALLKDFNDKHFKNKKKWKENIISFIVTLLSCNKFLTLYFTFFLLSYIYRSIIRKGVIFLLGKDDIFCYILVVLLSITIIIYISNILWKLLNCLFSRLLSGVNRERITIEDFYLFNKKVTDNVTIYNCGYIILILYISQKFTTLYFIVITFFLIFFIIIWVNLRSLSIPTSLNIHPLKAGIPLNTNTLIGVIGATLCGSHLQLEDPDIVKARSWRFENESNVYSVIKSNTPIQQQDQNLQNQINTKDSQILKLVHCYENKTRELSVVLNKNLNYELVSIRLKDFTPFSVKSDWILGYIGSIKTYVLTIFITDSHKYPINKNNLYYPTYHLDSPTCIMDNYNKSYNTNMQHYTSNRDSIIRNILVITPGKMWSIGNHYLNIVEIPRPFPEYTIDPIINNIHPLQFCMDSLNENNRNEPKEFSIPWGVGVSLDYVFHPLRKIRMDMAGNYDFRYHSGMARETQENENVLSKIDLSKISLYLTKSYFYDLFTLLVDNNYLYGPMFQENCLNTTRDEIDGIMENRLNNRLNFRFTRGIYKFDFESNKSYFKNLVDRKPNQDSTDVDLKHKRLNWFNSSNDVCNFALHIVNNSMEFLKLTNISGVKILHSMAFLEKGYTINLQNYSVHNPMLIYNIFNSDLQLRKFLAHAHSHYSRDNKFIFFNVYSWEDIIRLSEIKINNGNYNVNIITNNGFAPMRWYSPAVNVNSSVMRIERREDFLENNNR